MTWFLRGWSFYDELHNSDTSCLRVDQVDSIPTPLGELNYANFLNKNQPTIKSNHKTDCVLLSSCGSFFDFVYPSCLIPSVLAPSFLADVLHTFVRQLQHFAHRILDLLEIFVQRNPDSPHVIYMPMALLHSASILAAKLRGNGLPSFVMCAAISINFCTRPGLGGWSLKMMKPLH